MSGTVDCTGNSKITFDQKKCYLVFGFIRYCEPVMKLMIPDDIKYIVVLLYHWKEYFESYGGLISCYEEGTLIETEGFYFPVFNTAFGSAIIDASRCKRYEWKFQIVELSSSYHGAIAIGIVCVDDASDKLMSLYQRTYFFRRNELDNYSMKNDGSLASSSGYSYANGSRFDTGDVVTMSLGIAPSSSTTLSFRVNHNRIQNVYQFDMRNCKFKMAVALYKGGNCVRLFNYREFGRDYGHESKYDNQILDMAEGGDSYEKYDDEGLRDVIKLIQ
eukprot:531149_1